MKKIYYAHSKLIYGTDRERKELAFLRKKYEVVDPNADIGELGDLKPYLKHISECDMVVCSEYKGCVGRGVYEEVNFALGSGKPVLCLKKTVLGFKYKKVKAVETVDETDWKVKYGKVVF